MSVLGGRLAQREVKPDLAAPGVNIRTIGPNNSFVEVSGTSFATPFVTGSAALMMEWGIVRGEDPFLYDAVIIGLRGKPVKQGVLLSPFSFQRVFNARILCNVTNRQKDASAKCS